MTEETEIRFKLPQKLHLLWSNSASTRGLTLKAFVVSLVSAELMRTGELTHAAMATPTSAPAPTRSVWDDDDDF